MSTIAEKYGISPGKWRAAFNGHYWEVVEGPAAYTYTLALIVPRAKTDHAIAVAAADARVMAEAPALIALAEMVVASDEMNRWGDACMPIVVQARAILARIEVSA